jgi:serine/threonine-protein kinase RsbW
VVEDDAGLAGWLGRFGHGARVALNGPASPSDGAGVPPWLGEAVQSAADMEGVIRAITAAMAEAGFPEREAFAVHLALEEAIVNAHQHGHRGEWSPPIAVRYRVGADGLVAQVEDRGAGFDPGQVPDPLAPENLERPSGRGLLLMRAYMTGVCHNERGNCVCLCKHRPGPSGKDEALLGLPPS